MTLRRRAQVLALLAVLTGCAGLIGVPDLTYDESAPQGSSGNTSGGIDGSSTTPKADGSTSPTEAGTVPCDESKLATDENNCGRCGHDCVGGACEGGQCKPVALGAIGSAPLRTIVEHGDDLYVSTKIKLVGEVGGIWRVAKSGSPAPTPYVTLEYAEEMTIIGDTLYFIVQDQPFVADSGTYGGLWSCDLKVPGPCTPKLVAAAETPYAIASDLGKVYYTDYAGSGAILQYEPGSAGPTVFRPGYVPLLFWVDGQSVYYLARFVNANPYRVKVFDVFQDAGDATELDVWTNTEADLGVLTGSANALYYSANVYTGSTAGLVRRLPRPGTNGATLCDYGGTTNKRPEGIHLDGARIYWANQGDFAPPYGNGSIASCERDGCCTAPTTHWTGSGEPTAITGDAKAIYWVTYRTGEIWKLAKP